MLRLGRRYHMIPMKQFPWMCQVFLLVLTLLLIQKKWMRSISIQFSCCTKTYIIFIL